MLTKTERKRREAEIEECYGDADVVVVNGWGCGPGDDGHAIIGFEAITERGEVFLSAYHDTDDDVIIASGCMLPEELPKFKRMAAVAGVKLRDGRAQVTS